MKKTVAELRAGDRFYWGKSIAIVVDIVEVTADTVFDFRTFSLELKVPARRWGGAIQARGDQQVELVTAPQANPWSRHRELRVGQREEMEHTRSPRVAQRIARDHLKEDQNYYEKLSACGLVKPNPYYDQPEGYYDRRHRYCSRCGRREEDCQKYPLRFTNNQMCPGPEQLPVDDTALLELDDRPPKRNISADLPLSPKTRNWYENFHGTPPGHVDTRRTWLPGEMVLVGEGVDIGYKIKDAKSAKEHRQPYVHEFGRDVKVYRRAKRGERPTRTWYNFPTELRVLGFNLGFSYADKVGEIFEVKGSDKKYLAVTPSGRTLVVVGPSGVEFALEGGAMIVKDWIYH